MSRSRARAGALLVALAVGLGLVAPGGVAVAAPSYAVPGPAASDASVLKVDPATMPRGRAPRVAWVAGSTLHTPSGRALRVPRAGRPGGPLELLGRSRGGPGRRGWVLVDRGRGEELAFVLARGRIRPIRAALLDYASTTWTLAEDGTRVLATRAERDGTGSATVFALSGRRLDHAGFRSGPSAVGFTGPVAVLSNARRTFVWRVGGAPEAVATAPSGLGDVDADVLFVGVPIGLTGPTALSAPATPTWAARLTPEALSPGAAAGRLVLGRKGSYDNQLVLVRSVADGALVLAVRAHATYEDPVAWEDGRTVLLGARSGDRRVLVRCTLDGVCERASRWFPRSARFSLS